MFLAFKVEEVNALACSDFVYITDHAYTEDAIEQMEKTGNVDVLQHSLVKFAIELALLEYELVPVPGSKLAASALCLSLLLLEPQVKSAHSWSH